MCQRERINDTKLRIFLSKGYNFLFRLLFRVKEKDVDCGMRAFKRRCAKQVKFLYNPVGAELFAKGTKLGWKIARIGVTHLKRTHGKSHFSTPKLPFKLLKIMLQTFKLRTETSNKFVSLKITR